MEKLIVVKPDKSSFKEKLDKLIQLGYLCRNRWDNNARVCVLEYEEDYSELFFSKKTQVEEFTSYNEDRNKTIITNIFQDCFSEILYATTLHYSKNIPLKYYQGEAFVSTSVLLTSKTTKTCLKGGKTQELLDLVQLSRYDPVEEHYHINDLSKIPTSQVGLYKKYFGQICPAPHFHFASKRNTEYVDNPSQLAINLHSLITYVEDIMRYRNSVLLKNDLGLPILNILKNPKIYQTTTNIDLFKVEKNYGKYSAKLQEDIAGLIQYNKAEHTKKVANNMLNPKTTRVYGLQALYIDLILLAGVSSGRGPGFGGSRSFGRRNGPTIKDELMLSSKVMDLGQNKQANNYTKTLQHDLFEYAIQEMQKGEKQNEF